MNRTDLMKHLALVRVSTNRIDIRTIFCRFDMMVREDTHYGVA